MKVCLMLLLLVLVHGVFGQQHSHHQENTTVVKDIPVQPLISQTVRLKEALKYIGSPLSPEDEKKIEQLRLAAHSEKTVEEIQHILDAYCIALVDINPEARVKVVQGAAKPAMMQGGWTSYLVKVKNEGRVTAKLEVESPNALNPYNTPAWGASVHPSHVVSPGESANRFLDAQMFRGTPMSANLSGMPLEYCIVQLYSKDAGIREVELGFNVGQSTKDIGFRNTTNILFDIAPAVKVYFDVNDDDGKPVMGSFTITDSVDRAPGKLSSVYPLPSRRIAEYDTFPDFFFQQQVYRKTGEYVLLPPGKFTVNYTRGPEYMVQSQEVVIPENVDSLTLRFKLKRWINLSKLGWYSADHHIHASGCSHYNSPFEGVKAEDIWRQSLGEDLNVAAVLSWGPGWYVQKENFTGQQHVISTKENIMQYDVEISGFPSCHAGHLVLLRLKEDDYPGTEKLHDWPSWTLPILKWARGQGAVTGYAHSGEGLAPLHPTNIFIDSSINEKEMHHVPIWRTQSGGYTSLLPNYVTPRMDGIGANEYIVTAAHGLVDFYSAGNTPVHWELNMWYHTLNTGMRIPLSGETDFPCASDERVGHARSYFKTSEALNYNGYVEAIKKGRSYVSDGYAHILNYSVNGVEPGVKNSLVNIKQKQKVTVKADVAALLPKEQTEAGAVIAKATLDKKPHWSVERARVGKSRKVKVELVVNGFVTETKEIEADGSFQPVQFNAEITQSSWVALRIFAAAHTNPVYVELNHQPVLLKESVEWCIAALDQCWIMKEPAIREAEKEAAKQAYQWARAWYEKKLTTPAIK